MHWNIDARHCLPQNKNIKWERSVTCKCEVEYFKWVVLSDFLSRVMLFCDLSNLVEINKDCFSFNIVNVNCQRT